MAVIHKIGLIPRGKQTITIPSDAWVLSVQIQDGDIVLWYLHNNGDLEDRTVYSCWTGQDVDFTEQCKYLGTVVFIGHDEVFGLVYHFFLENKQ